MAGWAIHVPSGETDGMSTKAGPGVSRSRLQPQSHAGVAGARSDSAAPPQQEWDVADLAALAHASAVQQQAGAASATTKHVQISARTTIAIILMDATRLVKGGGCRGRDGLKLHPR